MIPILVADRNANIIFTNSALCKLIDCEEHELVERRLFDFLDPDDIGLQERFDAEEGVTEPIFHTATFNTPSGRRIELTFKIYPVLDEAKERTLYHVTVGVGTRLLGATLAYAASDDLRKNYAHSSLNYDAGRELYARLKKHLKDKERFLDPELDLDTLSRELQTNQLYLSQTVNFFSGTSFRDFINAHRVAYIASKAEALREVPISQLWQRAGFGSYSAFRRVVHSQFNATPRQWVTSLREKTASLAK